MKAIQFSQCGAPEVLQQRDIQDPQPGENEVVVRLEAAGVNFIDIYHRTGLYPVELPCIPGLEGAGVVAAIGASVSGLQPGERVAFAGVPAAYAEYALAPADRLIRIPDGVESKVAAAVMLQGMTAHYLSHSTYSLKPGDVCLVHAAAGGVGLLLVQMAKSLGAKVFGTVSTPEKEELARQAGADCVIRYTEQNFLEVVREETEGKGVNVVYDSVGQATFERSMQSLAPRGSLVSFGQSSGKIPPFDIGALSQNGSLFLTRPSLFHYIADRSSLESRANDVLGSVADGSLRVRIGAEYPLAKAAEAHTALESRETSGKVLLVV